VTLREQRVEFSKLLAVLVLWVSEQGDARGDWEIALDEVAVHSPRAAWVGGERTAVTDAVHKHGSFHHQGLAADLNLYVGRKWITDGGDPAWTLIGLKWEAMHGFCTWGGRWKDANHFSFGEGSKLNPGTVSA
jgi:hypothetical protein